MGDFLKGKECEIANEAQGYAPRVVFAGEAAHLRLASSTAGYKYRSDIDLRSMSWGPTK